MGEIEVDVGVVVVGILDGFCIWGWGVFRVCELGAEDHKFGLLGLWKCEKCMASIFGSVSKKTTYPLGKMIVVCYGFYAPPP